MFFNLRYDLHLKQVNTLTVSVYWREQVEQEIGTGICTQLGSDKIRSLQNSFTKIRAVFGSVLGLFTQK